MSSEPVIFKSHCNKCGRETNQRILFETSRTGTETYELSPSTSGIPDYETVEWHELNRVLQCQGCDTVSFRVESTNDLTHDEDTIYYPAAAYRPKLKWMDTEEFIRACPMQILELSKEAYVSLQNECYSSAAMCARAILELTMIEKVGDQGTFKANLDAFEKGGFMLPAQRDAIEAALETGSATIHRGYKPNALELDILLFQIESILALVYLKADHIKKLTARVPPRVKKSP